MRVRRFVLTMRIAVYRLRERWFDIRRHSPRLLLAAGDQVPIEAPFGRIAMLLELVDKYGYY